MESDFEPLVSLSGGRAADGAVVVDLDRAGRLAVDVLDRAVAVASCHPGLVVGRASDRLSPAARRLAEVLCTSVTAHDEGALAVVAEDVDVAVEDLRARIAARPVASRVLGQVLRLTAGLEAQAGVWAESLAYSMLLGGEEFRDWRSSVPVRDRPASGEAVHVEREGDVLRVVLARPESRNALDAAARGALSDALDVALADPSVVVELSGEGPVFCSGGDLDEFGTASDLAMAHLLRLDRGPALRMARLTERSTALVHGACVGAGVELPAFASRVVAAPGTTFRLPEVSMGLIPGAGGTVSLPRRVGRWRAAWWMLTGSVLDLDQASSWGLVDDVS